MRAIIIPLPLIRLAPLGTFPLWGKAFGRPRVAPTILNQYRQKPKGHPVSIRDALFFGGYGVTSTMFESVFTALAVPAAAAALTGFGGV